MTKRIIFIFSILVFPLFVRACFSPVDHFAVEVLLNKEGIQYDLSFFNERREDEVKREEGGIIYLSHFDPRVAVILSEIENKLSVRLQIPTKGVEKEYGFDLIPAVNLEPENFNWKEALKRELFWLRENKILIGLNNEDIEKICVHAKNGNAGFNQKIVWGKKGDTKNFTWLPYNQTENPILLKRMGCGGIVFSPIEEKIILPDSSLIQVPPTMKAEINPSEEHPIIIENKPLEFYELEIKEMPKISFQVQTPTIKETTLQIEIDKEKKSIKIEHEKISAVTKEPIKIEEKSLKIKTKKAEILINVLPAKAAQIAIQREPQKIKEIFLKVEKEMPIYEVKGEKEEKFLGIVPVKIQIKTIINAISEKIIKIRKPIFGKVLDILSF